MTTVRVQAFTDVGLQRARNEDAVSVGGWLCQSHTGVVTTLQLPVTLPVVCAVADGMGGHAGGHLASSIALSTLAGLTEKWSTATDIADSLDYINEQICRVGVDPELQGLGTTIAGVCIAAEGLTVFNVGDSRVYSIDDGFLQQISVDDSVHDAQGRTTNLVTQSLGQPAALTPHVAEFPLKPGGFLICSDGVSAVMSDADLRAAVRNTDMNVCASSIVEGTREGGAHDNFSFLLVQIFDVPADAMSTEGSIDAFTPSVQN